MSFDADKEEVREAVDRKDVDWLWAVISEAYKARDKAWAQIPPEEHKYSSSCGCSQCQSVY